MAFCGQYKLPPLKLVESQSAHTRTIHRGVPSNEPVPEVETTGPAYNLGSDSDLGATLTGQTGATSSTGEDMFDPEEPTDHELQTKAHIRRWEQLRQQILSVNTECSAMLPEQQCILCPDPAEFRCRDCGPATFYCKSCCSLLHKKANFFHATEQWQVRRIQVILRKCFILFAG